MTKKELIQLRSARERVAEYEERIERIRSRLESVTQSLHNTPVQTSRSDTMLNQIAILEEMQSTLEEKRLDLYRLVKIAYEEFDKLPDPLGKLMKLRYIDGLPWHDVAEELGYSESNCYKLLETYNYC